MKRRTSSSKSPNRSKRLRALVRLVRPDVLSRGFHPEAGIPCPPPAASFGPTFYPTSYPQELLLGVRRRGQG